MSVFSGVFPPALMPRYNLKITKNQVKIDSWVRISYWEDIPGALEILCPSISQLSIFFAGRLDAVLKLRSYQPGNFTAVLSENRKSRQHYLVFAAAQARHS